jgi:hypothetical protein
LETVKFEAGSKLTSIGNYAFYRASSLTSIDIPANVESIGADAFIVSGLNDVYIQNINKFNELNSTSFNYGEQSSFYGATSVTIADDGLTSFKHVNNTETNIDIRGELTQNNYSTDISKNNISHLIIGRRVTSIGSDAFFQASALTSVTIPSSVTSIGQQAFYGASALTSISIPAGVTSIGASAFYESGLTSISVDVNNNNYSSHDNGVLFNKDKTTLIQYPIGSTNSSYIIPEGVTSIGPYAFYRASALNSIIIPTSVTSIETNAFQYSGVTTVVIDDDNKLGITSPSSGVSFFGANVNTHKLPEPTDITLSMKTIEENSGIGAFVGTLTTSSSDEPNDTVFTYTIDNSSNFDISGDTLVTSKVFNYEDAQSFDISINSTNIYEKSIEKEFTIKITEVNYGPTDISLSNTTIPENSGIGAVVGATLI